MSKKKGKGEEKKEKRSFFLLLNIKKFNYQHLRFFINRVYGIMSIKLYILRIYQTTSN